MEEKKKKSRGSSPNLDQKDSGYSSTKDSKRKKKIEEWRRKRRIPKKYNKCLAMLLLGSAYHNYVNHHDMRSKGKKSSKKNAKKKNKNKSKKKNAKKGSKKSSKDKKNDIPPPCGPSVCKQCKKKPKSCWPTPIKATLMPQFDRVSSSIRLMSQCPGRLLITSLSEESEFFEKAEQSVTSIGSGVDAREEEKASPERARSFDDGHYESNSSIYPLRSQSKSRLSRRSEIDRTTDSRRESEANVSKRASDVTSYDYQKSGSPSYVSRSRTGMRNQRSEMDTSMEPRQNSMVTTGARKSGTPSYASTSRSRTEFRKERSDMDRSMEPRRSSVGTTGAQASVVRSSYRQRSTRTGSVSKSRSKIYNNSQKEFDRTTEPRRESDFTNGERAPQKKKFSHQRRSSVANNKSAPVRQRRYSTDQQYSESRESSIPRRESSAAFQRGKSFDKTKPSTMTKEAPSRTNSPQSKDVDKNNEVSRSPKTTRNQSIAFQKGKSIDDSTTNVRKTSISQTDRPQPKQSRVSTEQRISNTRQNQSVVSQQSKIVSRQSPKTQATPSASKESLHRSAGSRVSRTPRSQSVVSQGGNRRPPAQKKSIVSQRSISTDRQVGERRNVRPQSIERRESETPRLEAGSYKPPDADRSSRDPRRTVPRKNVRFPP